jgi:hypothetical protein
VGYSPFAQIHRDHLPPQGFLLTHDMSDDEATRTVSPIFKGLPAIAG